jgi:hypothetical protein
MRQEKLAIHGKMLEENNHLEQYWGSGESDCMLNHSNIQLLLRHSVVEDKVTLGYHRIYKYMTVSSLIATRYCKIPQYYYGYAPV